MRSSLGALALVWSGGEAVTWPERRRAGQESDPASRIFEQRVAAVRARVGARRSLPLLSTPTHAAGFITPEAFARRLECWKRVGEPPDPADAVLAVMRLPAGDRSAARRAIELDDERAARALDLAAGSQPDDYTMRVESRRSGRYTFYEIEAVPGGDAPATESCLLLRRALATGAGYSEGALDEGGIGEAGGLVRWAATTIPDDLAPRFAAGVRYLSFYLDGTLASGLHLEPALKPWVALGETGHWLVLLALAARGARAIEVGLDVAVNGIAQGRVQPVTLGAVLGELLPTGMLKAKRLATTLSRVAEASPRHAEAVRTVIARGLRGDPDAAPRDIASLLSVLHERLVARGGRLEDAEGRRWLEQQRRGGKVAMLRRAILALNPGL